MGEADGRSAVALGEAGGLGPRVEADEASGTFRVGDPRVFRAEGRGFCRDWLVAAAIQPGVRRASVDLATATALIEFGPGPASAAAMAATFASAVRRALAAPSPAPGRRLDWVALVAFTGPASPPWEVTRRAKGRLRLRPPALVAGRPRPAGWPRGLAGVDGVLGCRPAWISDALTVAFDPALANEGRIVDALRRTWIEAAADPAPAIAPRSPSRALNLAKAGGSFGLALVGIALPGIPTLPFLVGTSYYLARSSPRLDALLLAAPLFGPILREWEHHHGLSPASKAKILGLSAALMSISLALASVNPLALVPVLLISLASVYATLRIPGLPDDEDRTNLALTMAAG